MTRPVKALLTSGALTVVAALTSACGTQNIPLSKSNPLHQGAVLFNQRCAGCHTLSYAATHGSAANVRTAQYNNGPNFNIRCERPVDRVVYAIENGGFSGQIMPQNVVVGHDADEVAQFVATYAGRQAPKVPGAVQCIQEPIGSITTSLASASSSSSSSPSSSSSSSSSAAKKKPAPKK